MPTPPEYRYYLCVLKAVLSEGKSFPGQVTKCFWNWLRWEQPHPERN